MSIATEKVGDTFLSISTGVAIPCDWPLYAEDEVVVIYGKDSLEAILNVDYTVALDAPNYNQFTVTPLASLLTKINNLIAADATETNYVTIRRKLDYLTSVQPETVRYTAFLSREIERMHMRFQQLAEEVYRAVVVPVKNVGSTAVRYFIDPPVANRGLIWDSTGTKLTNGPDLSNLAAFEAAAADAITTTATNAATATTQAGIATTKAGEAATSAAAAAASAAGMKLKSPARASTTAALPACTYNNGAAGVGATLTATANGALAAQDGVTLLAGEALLVRHQATSFQNGIYTLTQAGSGGTPWILTRQTDSDTWAEIYAALVTVAEGALVGDTEFLCTSNNGGTMGVTAITWQQRNSVIADGAVSTTAKIVDGIITYAKIAAASIATSAEIIAGTASKIVDAAQFKAGLRGLESYTLLSSQTLSNVASANFTSLITSEFDEYVFELVDVVPATNSTGIQLRVSTDNGSSWVAGTSYQYVNACSASGSASTTGIPGTGASGILMTSTGGFGGYIGNDANMSYNATVKLFNANGNYRKKFLTQAMYCLTSTNQLIGLNGYGEAGVTTPINAIQFLALSGNLLSGTIRMYGVRKT